MSVVNIQIGEQYYNKDPQSTELGRKIIAESIIMLDQLGFEDFTFKKLAGNIESTEASIYRYFQNKLKLLVYLTSWYWAWMEYMIDYKTHHIKDNEIRLQEIIKILCHENESKGKEDGLSDMNIPGVNTSCFKRVVMSESDKTYLTKKVDEINSEGLFKGFKGLCHKIAVIIIDINPDYAYPHALVSTIMEASHQQAFFALHLPALTEIKKDDSKSVPNQVYDFINSMVFKLLS